MRLSRLKWLLMLLAAVIFITGIVAGRQTRRVDDSALKNAGKGTEWLTYGHSYSEQRYSTLKQIDATNVGRLGLGWWFEVGEGGGPQEATPLFANGVLYGITNWSITPGLEKKYGVMTHRSSVAAFVFAAAWRRYSVSFKCRRHDRYLSPLCGFTLRHQ